MELKKSIPYHRELFAQRLKNLRREFNLTQPEFARLIGKTRGAVGHWEIADREPTLGTMYEIAKVFNVSVDYLLGISDLKRADESIEYLIDKLREGGLIVNNEVDEKSVDSMIEYIYLINRIKKDNRMSG